MRPPASNFLHGHTTASILARRVDILQPHVMTLTVGIAAVAAALAASAAPRPAAATTTILSVQDSYPDVSTDGRLVFQSNRMGGTKLFVSKLDGSDLHQVTSGPSADRTPTWSPDGKFIAFAALKDGIEDIWIVRPDGSELRNLTNHPPSNSHPSWSPDGKRIVFCSTRGDGQNDDLYVINVDGTGLARLTNNGPIQDTFPSFSPDSSKIVFRRLLRADTAEGTLTNSEIMVMDSDGSNVVNLTKNPWFDGWPSWSPDGRYIAFSSNREDFYQIFVMNSDGSEVQQIVHSSSNDERPKWQPHGRGLVFSREGDGRIETIHVEF